MQRLKYLARKSLTLLTTEARMATTSIIEKILTCLIKSPNSAAPPG